MRALPQKNGGLVNIVPLPGRKNKVNSRVEKFILGGKT